MKKFTTTMKTKMYLWHEGRKNPNTGKPMQLGQLIDFPKDASFVSAGDTNDRSIGADTFEDSWRFADAVLINYFNSTLPIAEKKNMYKMLNDDDEKIMPGHIWELVGHEPGYFFWISDIDMNYIRSFASTLKAKQYKTIQKMPCGEKILELRK